MSQNLKILVIDDDEVDRMAVSRALKKAGLEIEISEAGDYKEAMAILEDTSFDCIFLDYRLPDRDGLALVQEIRACGNQIPLVVLTGQGDERIAVDLMKAGASDYLTKSRLNPEQLSHTLRSVMRIYEAEQQARLFHQQLLASNEQLRRKNQELEEKQQQIHQQNIKLLEASELKSRFLATMSHELRTPLNAIIAFSQIMLRKTKDKLNSKEMDMMRRIHNNGNNLLLLINDILDISKIEAGGLQLSPESFNIEQMITTTTDELHSLAAQKHLTLNVGFYVKEPELINDKSRLRQVVVNLISNAIKFTDTGGVKVEVNEMSTDKIAISVKDTGIGIATEDLEHIFEPFRQVNQSISRKYQGTGLGLAITNSLVQMMSGRIIVESTLGKGSVFRVELPRQIQIGDP
ncbi:MAG: ATP-binding protein [Nostocaceae cyanobacterium]|nr:ATP-binding protein [Nostocaceae cyanobacterium]